MRHPGGWYGSGKAAGPGIVAGEDEDEGEQADGKAKCRRGRPRGQRMNVVFGVTELMGRWKLWLEMGISELASA